MWETDTFLTTFPKGTPFVLLTNWDINLLYATNKNEVIEILDPAVKDEQLVLGSLGNLTVVALEGQPYARSSVYKPKPLLTVGPSWVLTGFLY